MGKGDNGPRGLHDAMAVSRGPLVSLQSSSPERPSRRPSSSARLPRGFGVSSKRQSWLTCHPRRVHQPRKFYFRVVSGNQVRPSIRAFLFRSRIPLPPEVDTAIENAAAFQVFHRISPKLLWQVINYYTSTLEVPADVQEQRFEPYYPPDAYLVFFRLHLQMGLKDYYNVINSPDNAIATDGNLGGPRRCCW